MLCVHVRLAVFVERSHRPARESVASDYFICFRIPHYKLETGLVVEVEVVQVARSAASSADGSERDLAQAADFLKHIRCTFVVDYIYLIVSSVCVAEEGLFVKFALKQSYIDGVNDRWYHRFTY